MADTIQSLSLVTLAQEYRGDVVRMINRRTMALKLFRVVSGSGKNIAWAPETSGQLAENYSEGADAANFGSDAQLAAVLPWALYRGNFHVSNLAMDGAVGASSPVGNRMLWARNLVNASAALASLLNVELYAGPGTGTRMAGLDVAIGSTTNTYAGLDRTQAANALFRPTVVDPGSLTAPTFALIRDDLRKIFEACGETPDVALCSPAVFNAVGNLFDANRRYVQSIETAKGKIDLNFGYAGIEIDGTVFVKDKDATANQIYYINSNHIHLEVLPPSTMVGPAPQVQADDGFGAAPLGFKYELLAKTGPSEKAEVLSTLNLVVDRPNAHGVRKNVSA